MNLIAIQCHDTFFTFSFKKLDKRLEVASGEEKRDPVFAALHPCLVFSDESDEEDLAAMVTRTLAWRTEEVSNFFHVLDLHDKPAEEVISEQKGW